MQLHTLFALLSAGSVLAFPGMDKLVQDLSRRQTGNSTIEMIGDLIEGATTPIGEHVRDCLLGKVPCEDFTTKTYKAPGTLGSPSCVADTCCVWDFIQRELVPLFTEPNGECTPLAAAAVRLGFHDAATWSKTSDFGGADGSILLSDDEILRSENNGLQEIRDKGLDILARYGQYGAGAADLVQFMHNLATVVCPLGPKMLTLIGREDNSTAAPRGLLPDAFDSADRLVELFANKTISILDLVALLGAHTTARQKFTDTARAGQPLDSTPGIWDVEYYKEILNGGAPAGVFRIQSEEDLLKNNPTAAADFALFADPESGQSDWNTQYAIGTVRFSLLGVNKINHLTDCTKVLPNPITDFPQKQSTSFAFPLVPKSSYVYLIIAIQLFLGLFSYWI